MLAAGWGRMTQGQDLLRFGVGFQIDCSFVVSIKQSDRSAKPSQTPKRFELRDSYAHVESFLKRKR